MSDPACDMAELRELCWAQQADELSPEAAARLEQLVVGSPAACDYYVRYVGLCATVEWSTAFRDELSDQVVGKVLQKTSALAASPAFGFLGNAAHGTVGRFSAGWPVAYLVAMVVLGIGFLIGSLIPASPSARIAAKSVPLPSPLSSHPSVVGRITGVVDCQWKEGSEGRGQGAGAEDSQSRISDFKSYVSLGDKLALSSGLLEITYDSGAKVILQGPVTYEVESRHGGFLSVGKLTARLEMKGEGGRGKAEGVAGGRRPVTRGNQQSTINNQQSSNPKSQISDPSSPLPLPPSAFVVRTPTAIVTDLGTEFGIEVDQQGATTSHVFRGIVKVQVAPGNAKTGAVVKVLHENQSARVDNRNTDHIAVLGPLARSAVFVREIPKQTVRTFDLVDVVAGGDGFSGRRNAGIDVTNGRVMPVFPTHHKGSDVVGDWRYHRVEKLPLVDGVFIPDGSHGPMQIDSLGHTFEFPSTDNITGLGVWAGGSLPKFVDRPDMELLRTVMDGVDYASAGHGMIFLHANKGITFDLDAVRRANPGYRVARFRAAAGNTEIGSEKYGEPLYADIWVLVDGQVRFRRREITGYNGAFTITFPLDQQDRFLTLVATDGGNGHQWDWIIFGDPRLELAPTKHTAGPASP
jgi:hypothetical protein